MRTAAPLSPKSLGELKIATARRCGIRNESSAMGLIDTVQPRIVFAVERDFLEGGCRSAGGWFVDLIGETIWRRWRPRLASGGVL
jgi:hypothetical protein